MLTEFPSIRAKQKTISKALEGLNLESLKDQITHVSTLKVDRVEFNEFIANYEELEGKLTAMPSQLKKLSHQLSLTEEEHVNVFSKFELKIAGHLETLTEHSKKIEWFESIIGNMKKRMTEIQKLGKATQAKVALAGDKSALSTSMDPEEE